MSVLIKGMEMPKSCHECPCEQIEANHYGDVIYRGCPYLYKGYTMTFDNERREDCPLIEIPPHGRLIDSTIIERAMTKACNECRESCIEFDGFYADCENCIFYDVVKALHDAPTIIPAEESEA